jgi:hypothetical protein
VRHLLVNAVFVALCLAILSAVWLAHRSRQSPDEPPSDTPEGSRAQLSGSQEQREQYGYTDPLTGQSRWLSLGEALANKAERDKASLDDVDAEAGETA